MNNLPFITVITPTFNRASYLPRLFHSIAVQCTRRVEWIVVDDGSTDDTAKVVQAFDPPESLSIRYFNKKNGGKLSAQAVAYKNISAQWFVVIDSDDYFDINAFKNFFKCIDQMGDEFDSFLFHRKSTSTNHIIGQSFPLGIKNYYDLYNFNVKGDKVHLMRSDFFKHYSPTIFDDENYISVSQQFVDAAPFYRLQCCKYAAVLCEYLNSGLSKNITRNRRRCPKNSQYTYYNIFSNKNFNFKVRARACINYYRFCPVKNRDYSIRCDIFYKFLGYMFYHLDSIRLGGEGD